MPQVDTQLQVGDPAPAFSLPSLKGGQYSLAEMLRQGPLLLFFFRGTWCAECRSYMRVLERSYEDLLQRGLQLAGVAHQRADIVASYFRLEPISYPYLLDSNMAVITRYGLVHGFALGALLVSHMGAQTTYPAAFLIDQAGIIRWAYVSSDKNDLPPVELIVAQLSAVGLRQLDDTVAEG